MTRFFIRISLAKLEFFAGRTGSFCPFLFPITEQMAASGVQDLTVRGVNCVGVLHHAQSPCMSGASLQACANWKRLMLSVQTSCHLT